MNNLFRKVSSVTIVLLGLAFLTMSGCTHLSSKQQTEITQAHYKIYRGDGSPASLDELLAASAKVDVTFLGEEHNDPVAHYLELLILEQRWHPTMALSLEMFESDVQYVLDEYLDDLIREDHLMSSGRAWDNYKDDYNKLIEFMKEKQADVIAANAPRRYVNRVSRLGRDSLNDLPDSAKQYLPPLPYAYASDSYSAKFVDLMQSSRPAADSSTINSSSNKHGAEQTQEEIDDALKKEQERQERQESIQRTLQAQSLWDASMAYSISRYLADNPDAQILHLNGGFHSAQRMGILEHLNQYQADISSIVVTILTDQSFPNFDSNTMIDQGDFVIVTDPSLPRS